jgi:drug/metabolite transporter (DMT)-like permease
MILKNFVSILLMIGVALFQAFISTIVKSVSPFITTGVEVLSYYLIPLLFFIYPILKNSHEYKTNRRSFTLFVIRGFLSASSVFLFFYATQKIPIGVATILFNTTPIFVPVLAFFILGEKCSRQVWLGIFISLIGVLFIIHPGLSDFVSFYCLVGLGSGFVMALSQVILRSLAKNKILTSNIVFYQYLTCTFFSFIFILCEIASAHKATQIISISYNKLYFVLIMLMILGIIGIVAQLCLTKAFKYMPAAKLTPFLYISIPISCFLGWFFWNQNITEASVIGTCFIVIGICTVSFGNSIQVKKLLHTLRFNH